MSSMWVHVMTCWSSYGRRGGPFGGFSMAVHHDILGRFLGGLGCSSGRGVNNLISFLCVLNFAMMPPRLWSSQVPVYIMSSFILLVRSKEHSRNL